VEDGTIDAVVSGHEPHRSWETDVEFGDAPAGIGGIETAVSLLVSAVGGGVLGLEAAVRAVTSGPAQVLGEAHRGLVPGRKAYLTFVDASAGWRPRDGLVSRARNTPLLDSTLRGRVVATVVGGRFAFVDPGSRERLSIDGSPSD
jgi:dihydroorotase